MAVNDKGLTIEVGNFNAAMRAMAAELQNTVTQQQIIDFEVGKIIEGALEKTDTATVASITESMDKRQWITVDGKPLRIDNRYRPSLRSAVRSAVAASRRRKLGARGLAKRSWLALAQAMGQMVRSPAYVQRAEAPNHTSAENVNVQRSPSSGKYGVAISNKSPLLRWTGARQAFFAAVAGRRKFFDQNLARGVFNKLSTVAKKYKGLIVNVPV